MKSKVFLNLPGKTPVWNDMEKRELEWDTSEDLIKEFYKGKRPGDKEQPEEQTILEMFG
jgi:hypothetical protein